ncbi:MAG: aquaporin family protein [Cyclobacteriaceae bacterium]|nr:aquaporin family protein [Cyclobacteriaceae bacterium]MCH8517079.1 aquaporin family protein [Cyclobacteriaceae bacterium]
MHPYLAELIGTALLLLMGSGVVANVVLNQTKGNQGGWMVITTAWALGVFIGVVVAGPYSGAHLNPAVSFALCITGDLPWSELIPYSLAQLVGAAIGSGLTYLIYKPHFDATNDADAKLAIFCTAPAIRYLPSNISSEVIGTFVLIFVVLYMGDPVIENGEKTPLGLGALGAIPVAFLVWVIGLALGGTTGYAINPARDLGPRIMHALLPIKNKRDADWSYSWLPIFAPLLGALLAALLALHLS